MRIPEYKNPSSHVHLHAVKCHSWFCPLCRKSRARRFRFNLLQKITVFKSPRLFTLTIDPKHFNSPRDAYDYVRSSRFISRLFRLLGVRTYVVVLECHKSGFPHWHCLIDVEPLPSRVLAGRLIPHFIDLDKAHRLWHKWGIGKFVYLSQKSTCSPEHAVNYISKYLSKMPVSGYPDWLLESSNVRLISTSRSVGSLMSALPDSPIPDDDEDEYDDDDDEEIEEEEEEKDEDETGSCKRPVFQRVLECSLKTFGTSDGHYVGEVLLSIDDLKKIPAGCRVLVFDSCSEREGELFSVPAINFGDWEQILILQESTSGELAFRNNLNRLKVKRAELYGYQKLLSDGVPF